MNDSTIQSKLRPVITASLVFCILVAVAPWMSGGQDTLAMLLSGAALLLGSLLVWRQPVVRAFGGGPLLWGWLALLAFASLSLLWSANRYSTGVWIVHWLMAGLVFWLAYVVADEVRGREWLMRGYLALAAVFCIVAIAMYMTSSYSRLTGTFYWANPAAAYLIPALVVVVDRARRAVSRRASWGWVLLAALFGASFLLTDSRGAMLVLAIISISYLVVVPTSRQFWTHFVFIIALSLGLSFGLVKLSSLVVQHSDKVTPGSRLAEAASGESQSISDRINYLGSAFEIWFAHPVGGSGAGTYGDVHPQYQQRVVSASTNAHNLYVQVLSELGLVGAVLLASVLLWLAGGVLRGFLARPEMLAVLIGVAGLLLHFGLDIDAAHPALLSLAALLLGLLYRRRHDSYAKTSWRGPAIAVLALLPVTFWYQSNVLATRAQVAQADADYEGAAEFYAAANSKFLANPDYISAEGIDLYTLGLGQGKAGRSQLDQALKLARRAQQADPHDGQHYQLEGRVLRAEGDLAGAQRAFRKALELDPHNHPDYAFDLATTQGQAGNTADAVRTAKAMLQQYPAAVIANRDADASVRPALAGLEALVGNAALKAGKVDEAEAAAKRALEIHSGNLYGRALQHQVDEARQQVAKNSAQ